MASSGSPISKEHETYNVRRSDGEYDSQNKESKSNPDDTPRTVPKTNELTKSLPDVTSPEVTKDEKPQNNNSSPKVKTPNSKENTENDLTADTACVMCKKTLQSPRLLPCLHSLCFKCLDSMLDSNKSSDNFSCPACEEATTTLSPEFISNVYLEGILSIHKTKTGEPQDCVVCSLKNLKTEAVYECLECVDLLCESCGNAHSSTRATVDHRVISLGELATGKYDDEIRQQTRVHCRNHSEEAFDNFCSKCNKMVCRECRISEHFGHKFVAIEDAHENIKNEILDRSERVVKKQEELSTREDKIETVMSEIDSTEKSLIAYLDKATAELIERIMHEKQRTLKKLQRYMNQQRAECMEQKQEVQTEIQRMRSGVKICNDVIKNGKPDEIIFMSSAMSRRLHQLASPVFSTKEDVSSELPTIALKDELRDIDFLHVFDFFPDIPGDTPSPRMDNRLAKRSTVSMQLVEKITTLCPTDYQQPRITGIACMTDGRIVVADSSNTNVKIFTQKGVFISTLLTCKPVSIAVCNNILAITDKFSVLLMSTDKKFKRRLPQEGNGSSFAISAMQNKYFAILTAYTQFLKIFDTKGQFVQAFPVAKSKRKVIHRQPMHLTTNSKGEIIFSDWGTNSVVHMSTSGEVMHEYRCNTIGKYNHGWMPCGLCVDAYDNVFVANQQSNDILILNSDLKLIHRRKTQRDDMERPTVITSDGRGHVFVAGKGKNINSYTCKYTPFN